MSKNIETANIIRSQLGGNRFAAMTGAKQMVAIEDGLQFKLPGKNFARNGINCVQITLNSMDAYDCRYMRIYGGKVTIVADETGIYGDMLQDRFKAITGLDTHL